jgi:hypothetical protein
MPNCQNILWYTFFSRYLCTYTYYLY